MIYKQISCLFVHTLRMPFLDCFGYGCCRQLTDCKQFLTLFLACQLFQWILWVAHPVRLLLAWAGRDFSVSPFLNLLVYEHKYRHSFCLIMNIGKDMELRTLFISMLTYSCCQFHRWEHLYSTGRFFEKKYVLFSPSMLVHFFHFYQPFCMIFNHGQSSSFILHHALFLSMMKQFRVTPYKETPSSNKWLMLCGHGFGTIVYAHTPQRYCFINLLSHPIALRFQEALLYMYVSWLYMYLYLRA